ncbi:MAG: PASTA domain-containing protein, partial [Lachnospiraceae bacterium]
KISKVTVPYLLGNSKDAALQALAAVGLTGTVKEQNDNNVTAGYVISASVAADTEVAPGTNVEIVVSKGPAAPVEKPPVETPPTNTGN